MNSRSPFRWSLFLVAAAFAPASLPAALSCESTNILLDGGFERALGTPPASPHWDGSSTHFGSPVCSVDECAGLGATAPRSGEFWTLFGASTEPGTEIATLTQTLVLPVSSEVSFDFQLWISDVAAPFTDTLRVWIDGDPLALFTEPAVAGSGYVQHSYVLDAYADGLEHTLEFEYTGPDGGGFAAFNLDDVRIVAQQVTTFADGGFEAASGTPLDSPSWVEASLQFSSPLCTLAACGDGEGTVGPRIGTTWAWFGGVAGNTPETSSVTQTFYLPFAAYVDLNFYLGIGAVAAPFTDELTVTIDGTEVASFLEPAVADSFYSARSTIVDPYADGLPHELRFEYVKGTNGNVANFSLDDIELAIVGCEVLLLDGFETHDTSNWSVAAP